MDTVMMKTIKEQFINYIKQNSTKGVGAVIPDIGEMEFEYGVRPGHPGEVLSD